MKQNILDICSQLPCSSANTCLTLFYICISLYWVVVVGPVGSVLQYCKLLVAVQGNCCLYMPGKVCY